MTSLHLVAHTSGPWLRRPSVNGIATLESRLQSSSSCHEALLNPDRFLIDPTVRSQPPLPTANRHKGEKMEGGTTPNSIENIDDEYIHRPEASSSLVNTPYTVLVDFLSISVLPIFRNPCACMEQELSLGSSMVQRETTFEEHRVTLSIQASAMCGAASWAKAVTSMTFWLRTNICPLLKGKWWRGRTASWRKQFGAGQVQQLQHLFKARMHNVVLSGRWAGLVDKTAIREATKQSDNTHKPLASWSLGTGDAAQC